MNTETNLKLFKDLSDQLAQADFQTAQGEYFHKHADKFQDTEENKLEYTELHQQYVYILDEVIEANLKSKYTDEQISAFYEHFKTNLKDYELVDKVSVDTLFGFLDFQTFKSQALKMKEGAGDYTEKELQESKDSLNFSDASKFDELAAEDITDPSFGWKKSVEIKPSKKTQFHGAIHTRPQIGSKLNLVRSEFVLENLKLSAFVKYIAKIDKMNSESKHIKERYVVERYPDDFPKIMYSRVKIPMMTDRESLLQFTSKKESDTVYKFITESIERDDFPEKKGVIRLAMFKASRVEQVGKDLRLLEFSSFDMKGSFPARLINMMMASSAKGHMNTFIANLKKLEAEA